jgi:hypothetical protein
MDNSVIPGPGFMHSGVTFLTRNPEITNWIPACAGMTLPESGSGMMVSYPHP